MNRTTSSPKRSQPATLKKIFKATVVSSVGSPPAATITRQQLSSKRRRR